MKNKKCCGECWQHPCPHESERFEQTYEVDDSDYKPQNVIVWLAFAWLLLILLVRIAFADDGLQEIKRGVDVRGERVVYNKPLSKTSPAPDGRFEGNCGVFALTYVQEARKAGYAADTTYYKTAGGYHAVAVAVGRDGEIYVMDSNLDWLPTLKKHRKMMGY